MTGGNGIIGILSVRKQWHWFSFMCVCKPFVHALLKQCICNVHWGVWPIRGRLELTRCYWYALLCGRCLWLAILRKKFSMSYWSNHNKIRQNLPAEQHFFLVYGLQGRKYNLAKPSHGKIISTHSDFCRLGEAVKGSFFEAVHSEYVSVVSFTCNICCIVTYLNVHCGRGVSS